MRHVTPSTDVDRERSGRSRPSRSRGNHRGSWARRGLAAGAAAILAVGLSGATTDVGTAVEGAERDRPRSQLQRDADALTALGIAGVQARQVTPSGRNHVVTSGVADVRTRRPVPRDGRFRIGSVNKTFVATVALQLVGEGRLSLDDSVERWLPGVVDGEGYDAEAITVRQLLQHTSGIGDDYLPMDTPEQYYENRFTQLTDDQLVDRAMVLPPAFAPGTGWQYSNTGYVLIGMIIERVTGRPWYAEVHDRVIEPLDLTATTWPGASPSLPRPHAHAYQRFTPDSELVDVTLLNDVDASGGLISTTRDLDRFNRALIGGELLGPAELVEMRRTVPVDEETATFFPGARYGLGILQRPLPCGGTYWAPGGDQVGWTTRTGITPDGRRSVVASLSTQLADMDGAVQKERAVTALVEHALCTGR